MPGFTSCPDEALGAAILKSGVMTSCPDKALRAAVLKLRFADIISKADSTLKGQKMINGETKIKNAAVLKAAISTLTVGGGEKMKKLGVDKTKTKNQTSMKKKAPTREEWLKKQRNLARMALEEMERTVYIEDNLKVMKDFEMLINM